MIKALDLCAYAEQALADNWGYIWGTVGILWTDRRQKRAIRPEVRRYGSRWIGHIVADCAGLMAAAFRHCGGKCHQGSNLIWMCDLAHKGEIRPDTQLLPGYAVFKRKRKLLRWNRYHVGWFVGNGRVIESRGVQYGVIESNVSEWHDWGEFKGVDYSGVSV